MNESDLLTIILGSGKIEGRTALQKLAYFTSLKIHLNLGFIAHYYGPYSPTVAVSLENLTALGLAREEVRLMNNSQRTYTYSLTKGGQRVSYDVERSDPKRCERVRGEIDKIMQVTRGSNKVLICAAKVHYILGQKKAKRTSYRTIRNVAKSFGWDISADEIDSGAELLQALGLAKKAKKSKET